MPLSRLSLFVLIAAALTTGTLCAQQSSEPVVNDEFVQAQFGTNCQLISMPPLKADLDGDGIEDVVIPARCTSPLMDQAEHSYVVLDPFNSFFGYGNPKVTTGFVTEDPRRRGFSLLVIHGTGDQVWHAPTPKSKFMLVNIPFRDVRVRKLQVKKKLRMAIYVDETGGNAMTSAVFWDGKKYKYQPMGSTQD